MSGRALVGFCDLGGALRGKRVPPGKLAHPERLDLRMAASALLVDVWGADLEGHPAFAAGGDPDGRVVPTGRPPIETAGADGAPTRLLPAWFVDADGRPLATDPRGVLARAAARLGAMGLTPVVGCEWEFALVDPRARGLEPARRPGTDRPMAFGNLMSVDETGALGPFLDEVHARAAAAGIAVADMLCEGGAGQVEVTLAPRADALEAADDAFWLRHVVRAAAAAHGLGASFAAMPFAGQPGNGLHVHTSLRGPDGAPLFAAPARPGEDRAPHAVAGLLDALAEGTLVCAPHRNSYRRLRAGALAPSTASWGVDNRTCTLRLIEAPAPARRVENRLPGADCNPYLALALHLGALADGIEAGRAPPPPITGDAAASAAPRLPLRWEAAVDLFAASPRTARLLGPEAARALVAAKRQEIAAFEDEVPPLEARTCRELF